MKPEPLKGKIVKEIADGMRYGKISFKEPHIKLEDVRSAVDWLKHVIEEGTINLKTRYDLNCDETLDVVDEAFEDVMK